MRAEIEASPWYDFHNSTGAPEASLIAQVVKKKKSTYNLGDLGWEDPLEKGKATHSSILAWRIPWTWGHKESDKTERFSLSLSLSGVPPKKIRWPGLCCCCRGNLGLQGAIEHRKRQTLGAVPCFK